MTVRAITAITLMCLLLTMGCGKDTVSSASGMQSVWKKAGLESTSFETITEAKLGDATCQRGKVSGVETTVCVYRDEAAAKEKREAGLKLVGNHTGASLARGKLLLIVIDRERVDPSGRTINRITQSFRSS